MVPARKRDILRSGRGCRIHITLPRSWRGRSCHRNLLSTFLVIVLSVVSGCPVVPSGVDPINPFRDVPPIELDGQPHELTSTIIPIGSFEAGDVIRVIVTGEGIDAVLILIEDALNEESGVVAGGGQANVFFQYRMVFSGRYFIFVQFDPQVDPARRQGTITVEPGDPAFEPPATQPVVIVFTDKFLSDPGLYDPTTGAVVDQAFLESISGQVRDGVIQRLRTIFDSTPIDIFVEGDPLPAAPFSRVTILPDRVLADDPTLSDSALPPPDPTRPECQVRVVFGEVLPRGTKLDPGNRIPDDEAVVYVGSFQGRGETCQSAAIDSVNNIILGLAQTTAHEIGHLVGLFHVPLTDIMDRSPTLAFQRELTFQRGQLLIDAQTVSPGGTTELSTILLTTVIQDPAFYFQANFGG